MAKGRCRRVEFRRSIQEGKSSGPVRVCHPGKEERRLEIRSYKVYAGEVMHEIDTMSHIGTHVEVPSHFIEPLRGTKCKDLADFPPEAWMGEAVFINLAGLAPRSA